MLSLLLSLLHNDKLLPIPGATGNSSTGTGTSPSGGCKKHSQRPRSKRKKEQVLMCLLNMFMIPGEQVLSIKEYRNKLNLILFFKAFPERVDFLWLSGC